MSLDHFTADKVREMVKTVTDDAFIARYVGCRPEQVATVRRNTAINPQGRPKSLRTFGKDEGLGFSTDADFRLNAINGSTRLGEAIDKMVREGRA